MNVVDPTSSSEPATETAELGFAPVIPLPPEGLAADVLEDAGEPIAETMLSKTPEDFLPVVIPMETFDLVGDEELWAAKAASEHRDVMSSTSAARGCIETELPEDQVAPIFKKLHLQVERRGSLWLFHGSGERVASTFADVNTEISELSQRHGCSLPRAYLDTYSSGSGTPPIDAKFLAALPQMLRRCTAGSVVTSDTFYSLLKHPRVAIYVHKEVKAHGLIGDKAVYVLSELKSVINELRAGGAEKQYGRDTEMKGMLDWMTKFMGADAPMFSSFTVHGDAMMGKTRMAEEMIKAIRTIQKQIQDLPQRKEDYIVNHPMSHPKSLKQTLDRFDQEVEALPKHTPFIIFVPAKDTRMGDSLSFFRTYAKQILHAAQEVFTGDTPLPNGCKALENFDALDATTLAKEGPKMLSRALRRLERSGRRFLIVTDDMQWADSESCDLLKQTFAKDGQGELGHLALLNLARTGDQVMNQELLQILQSAPNVSQLSLKPLEFLDKHGVPTPLFISFVYGLLKVDPAHTTIDAVVFERLAQAVGGAQGNPGLLTEMINSMVQEGVLTVKHSNVTYDDRFFAWTTMGEADVLAAARVDRLLTKPLQREVLQYVMFLRETGECTYQFLANFFRSHLKRPDLIMVFAQLCKQGVFNLQKIDSTEEIHPTATIGFARDADERRLKGIFGNPALAQENPMAEAYKEIARYMLFTRDTLKHNLDDPKNAANRDAFLAVLDRCSPFAIYAMATKAKVPEMVKEFVLEAFKDAYARGQFDVALSVYEYMKSEPSLAPVMLNFGKNIGLQLDLIQCMQVKRNVYATEIEALGDKVRYFYAGKTAGLGKDQMLAKDDYACIERLHDLMCDFYFLRGSDKKVRLASVSKLDEWGKGMAEYLSDDAKQVFSPGERDFMDLKAKFNKLRGEYLMRRYAQACDDHADTYTNNRDSLLKAFPEFANDIRFQRVDLEGNRIFASAFHMGWNLVIAPGGDGYDKGYIAYGDDDAADFAALSSDNSLHANLLQSRKHYLKFFDVARTRPELVPDRTQLYRSRKSLGVIEGRLGNFMSSMQYFFDARSDCIKYGDTERYADTLSSMSSVLPKLIQYYQTTNDPSVREQISQVARLIERNEPGATLSAYENNIPVPTASYFILQWAAHYSSLAATTFKNLANSGGSPLHKSYHDVALVNLLSALSTVAEAATFHGNSVDDPSSLSPTSQCNYFIGDTVRRITEIGPNQTTSFLDDHRALDAQGNPDEYWSFYIAPFLARLMRHMSRLEQYPQLLDIVLSTDPSKASFASAIPALATEAAQLINEDGLVSYLHGKNDQEPPTLKTNIPQYAAVLEQKIADLAIADRRVKSLFPTKKV